MKKPKQQLDPVTAAGMCGGIDPDVIIGDEIEHQRPLKPGEDPVEHGKKTNRAVDRVIRNLTRPE